MSDSTNGQIPDVPGLQAKVIKAPVGILRQGWFEGYQAENDEDAWKDLPVDADCEEWGW